MSPEGEVHQTDTIELARLCAQAMDGNASGGMCCEPGLVFFQCNNHPCLAFRLLEGLGLGDFEKQRERWETQALSMFHAPVRSAGFKIFVVADTQRVLAGTPFGHLGGDGWNLTYYFAWARNSSATVPCPAMMCS